MGKEKLVKKLVRICVELLDGEAGSDLEVAQRCLQDALDFIESHSERG
jgi:hypothetical protein